MMRVLCLPWDGRINKHIVVCTLGGGCANHPVPKVINDLLELFG
jgi:hypothetical protein